MISNLNLNFGKLHLSLISFNKSFSDKIFDEVVVSIRFSVKTKNRIMYIMKVELNRIILITEPKSFDSFFVLTKKPIF